MSHPTGEQRSSGQHSGVDVTAEYDPIKVEVVSLPETQQSHSQTHFTTQSVLLTAGQTVILQRNPYRKRLVLWTDSGNTGSVYLSNKGDYFTGAAPYVNAVALAANSGLVEFQHTAEIALYSAANATVYYYEERAATE